MATVEEHIVDALSKGATVTTGGKPHALGDTLFEATIPVNVTEDMAVAREETFGPLAPLSRINDEADMIAQANDTGFSLASHFHALDIARVFRVVEALNRAWSSSLSA